MIRAGKSDQLVNNCESSIAQCVAAANSLWKDNDRRLSSFWYAQRYYQQFELDIPKELEPIFSTLPPRPLTSCESKRVTDSNQIRDTEQGAASHAASQRPWAPALSSPYHDYLSMLNHVQQNRQWWNASALVMLGLASVPYRSIWPPAAKSYWQSENVIFCGDFAVSCEIAGKGRKKIRRRLGVGRLGV